MEKGYMSPKKRDHRTFGGKRVTSTGLAGALKRQANNAVQCKREVILLEAQIADLPQIIPTTAAVGGGRVKNPLFGQLTKARAKLDMGGPINCTKAKWIYAHWCFQQV
jgi:hypothetical protein